MPSDPFDRNDRLNHILESNRQIAFDWSIADDCLRFDRKAGGIGKNIPIDTARIWRSIELPALMHPDDHAHFRVRLHEALRGNAMTEDGLHHVELRLKDTSGGWRWVDISGKIIERDRHGSALRMVGTFSNIDDRKQAERNAVRSQDLHDMLRQVNHAILRFNNRDALFREICRITVEHGRFAMAWIGLVDTYAQRLVPAAFYGDRRCDMNSPEGWSDYFALPEIGKDMDRLHNIRSIVYNDLEAVHMPQESRTLARRTGVQSLASFSFQCDGRLHGVVNAFALEKNHFDTTSIELLEQLAKDISFAVTRLAQEARREETKKALLESERFKDAILTAALDCIISINQNGEIISFNHAAETTFGYESSQVIGSQLTDIIVPPEWRERHRLGMKRFMASGETTIFNRRIELTAMRADGSVFPVELAIVPVYVHGTSIFTAFIRDISELKRSQTALKENAMRYRQLVELSPEAIFVHRNNKFVLCNQVAVRLLGANDASELLGREVSEFIHSDHHAACRSRIQSLLAGLAVSPLQEEIWLRVDGAAFDVETAATRVIYDDEAAIQAVVRDITVRKRAEQLQCGQNRILNMIAIGVALPRILHGIAQFIETQVQNSVCVISMTAGDATLSVAAAPSLPDACMRTADGIAVALSNGSCEAAAFRAEPVFVADIAGHPLWTARRDAALGAGLKACASWPIIGKNGKVLGTIALYFRESREPSPTETELLGMCLRLAAVAIESRESEERIRYMAHYDGLTSLPNRFLFKEFLDQALRNAQRKGTKFAVFFIDLDKFKDINDTLGHDAGDLVLKEIAARLRRCVRQADKIARMGGDEFYVLIEDLADGRDAADVAQKLLEEASRPIRIGQHECALSASIGIGIYPDDGATAKILLKNADYAMYEAKNQGKNAYRFFSDASAV